MIRLPSFINTQRHRLDIFYEFYLITQRDEVQLCDKPIPQLVDDRLAFLSFTSKYVLRANACWAQAFLPRRQLAMCGGDRWFPIFFTCKHTFIRTNIHSCMSLSRSRTSNKEKRRGGGSRWVWGHPLATIQKTVVRPPLRPRWVQDTKERGLERNGVSQKNTSLEHYVRDLHKIAICMFRWGQ